MAELVVNPMLLLGCEGSTPQPEPACRRFLISDSYGRSSAGRQADQEPAQRLDIHEEADMTWKPSPAGRCVPVPRQRCSRDTGRPASKVGFPLPGSDPSALSGRTQRTAGASASCLRPGCEACRHSQARGCCGSSRSSASGRTAPRSIPSSTGSPDPLLAQIRHRIWAASGESSRISSRSFSHAERIKVTLCPCIWIVISSCMFIAVDPKRCSPGYAPPSVSERASYRRAVGHTPR